MVGGWVPYWRTEAAIEAIKRNCDILDQLSLFSFEVDSKGHIKNPFKRKWHLWPDLYEHCKKKGSVKLLVPTIYWTDTQDMHLVLSNKAKRDEHIRQIIDIIVKNNFHGININYERVSVRDREDYLIFLRQLSQMLHKRGLVLYTSIGGRTGDNTIAIIQPNQKPVKHGHARHHSQTHHKKVNVSLNPGTGEDAIRYKKALAECCDQVHIMSYDEWGRPYKYCKQALKNKYYISHSSNTWTEQIIQYALTFIPRHKIVLGIPTYGLECAVLHKKDGDVAIFKRRNVTYPKAQELAAAHKVKPQRTAGGELCFIYKTHHEEERYVCFLDAQSVKDKAALVKKYGIKGMYLFTINGDVDNSIWKALRSEL